MLSPALTAIADKGDVVGPSFRAEAGASGCAADRARAVHNGSEAACTRATDEAALSET